MNKRYLTLLTAAMGIMLISCTTGDDVISKKKGLYTVNTTTLSQEVKGYNGPTPVMITIEKDRIVKVEALENTETPRFFEHMKAGGLLQRWDGMTVDEALTAKVDAVAGATYSSNAVIENVRLGIAYYQKHK